MCNVTTDRLVIPSVVEESNSYCHPRPNPVISTEVQRSGEISIIAQTLCYDVALIICVSTL